MVGLHAGELVKLMHEVVRSSRVRIPRRVYITLLTTMSTKSNDRVCSHSYLLFGVTSIIANAEEVKVEPFEALGSDMTRYAAELAHNRSAPTHGGLGTRSSKRVHLGLVLLRWRAGVGAAGRAEAAPAGLTKGTSVSSGSVLNTQ
jgi:hypothetical protein